MTQAVKDVQRLIQTMSPSEKNQVLTMVAQDPDTVYSGIAITPGVCGGSPRISGTRIPVWILQAYRQDGLNDDQLVENYPTLSREKLADAWKYVERNRELIDSEIAENEAA